MRLTKGFATICLCALCAQLAVAATSAELKDLAGRVSYGFYYGDARAIEAAQSALERQGDSPEARYYRDFAALRRAQLGNLNRAASEGLEACADREPDPKQKGVAAAEAWVLVAACAFVADDDRRAVEALESARANDDDNPRIALIDAWRVQREAGAAAAETPEVSDAFEAAVAAFDAWTPTVGDPDWGNAEALVALGQLALARGETREARDLMERALLLVPDYRLAVELRGKLQGNRAL
jgi:tetratricopeptide (TPR) repeat protein